jgi:uncharacterized membrane protein
VRYKRSFQLPASSQGQEASVDSRVEETEALTAATFDSGWSLEAGSCLCQSFFSHARYAFLILEPLEGIVRQITVYVAIAVEGAAALVVAVAILEGLLGSVRSLVPRRGEPEIRKETVRLRLGRWLSIVLEFLLAADILRTAIAPSWDDIGKLAAIAGIRTALNFFLQREVREVSRTANAPSATLEGTPGTKSEP